MVGLKRRGQAYLTLVLVLSGALRWKEELSRKAAEAFLRQQQATPNLRRLIYGAGKRALAQSKTCKHFRFLRLFSEKEMRKLVGGLGGTFDILQILAAVVYV